MTESLPLNLVGLFEIHLGHVVGVAAHLELADLNTNILKSSLDN